MIGALQIIFPLGFRGTQRVAALRTARLPRKQPDCSGWKGLCSFGKLIQICILAYTGIAVFAIQLDKQWEFWVLAVCVGLFQGGIQALSRSYFAQTPGQAVVLYDGEYVLGGGTIL